MVKAEASGSLPIGMGVCRNLAVELVFKFYDEDKDLPTAWEEFPSIQAMLDEKAGHLFQIRWINSFALIPEQPILYSELGCPREYDGMRLYLMSRSPQLDGTETSLGRCAIFLSAEGEGKKGGAPLVRFIDEDIAKKILEQLDGYELDKVPVAFSRKFVDQIELKRETDKEQYRAIIADFNAREKRIKGDERGVTAESERLKFQATWMAVVILVLAIVVWAAMRAQKDRP